ncbi:uncharacterized protein SPSK_09660 [Sporothrix schenckii 1099-18]|uniref:Uncharacterized protein n=1 Tax=Sporothrix schenckii 1099-18 TaxID=1397361 RepID=A0A0F2M7M8_SPOSC|nr:uncharacterized protein SPSK_09660 [Sporothrix schenckii 1099-18]KJR84181.1 hypothetical protein SPSK_09660 [Sporothrix schenckii 1099-18]
MAPQVEISDAVEESAIVPDVTFSNTKALFEQIDDARENSDTDSLVVGHISVNEFRAMEAERERRGRRSRFFFLPDLACLMVTIPTRHHERAHLEMYDCIQDVIKDMGLADQWRHDGGATFDPPGDASGSGEGDSSGGPSSRRDPHDDAFWPTLVIEAGVSQTLPWLRIKAKWWLTASNFHMKVVVLVKLLVATSTIQIEQWVAELSRPQRPGATTTRASHAANQPVVKQEVLMHWVGPLPLLQTPLNRRTLSNFRVKGAPLVLRFKDLMDRPPVPAAGEHDILISEVRLQRMAMRVW